MSKREAFIAAASFILEKEDKILMFYRTDGYFNGGWWVLPSGHVEAGETATQTVVREAKEELGVDIAQKDVVFAHLVHNLSGENKRMDFYFRVKNFTGEIKNLEPDKCAQMMFLSKDEVLKTDKIAPTTRQALKNVWQSVFYSERL